MKRVIILLACMACFNIDANAQLRFIDKAVKVIRGGSNATKGVTLSDSDIRKFSRQLREKLDSTCNMLPADSEAGMRLAKMTEKIVSVDGTTLNYGVYDTDTVDVIAFGEGSVRVTTGLMNAMEDDEVVALMGHVLGHVGRKDTKEAMKNTFYNAALKDAVGAVDPLASFSALSTEQWISMGAAFSGVQYSRDQELGADDYAFQFCLDRGVDPYALHRALTKLAEMSAGDDGALVAKILSAHPDTEERALRMKEKADEYTSR